MVLAVSVTGCGGFDASTIVDLFTPPSNAADPGYPPPDDNGDGIQVGDIVPVPDNE